MSDREEPDPWKAIADLLGTDPAAAPKPRPAAPPPPPPKPRRTEAPPPAPPAADWSALAADLGIAAPAKSSEPPKAAPTARTPEPPASRPQGEARPTAPREPAPWSAERDEEEDQPIHEAEYGPTNEAEDVEEIAARGEEPAAEADEAEPRRKRRRRRRGKRGSTSAGETPAASASADRSAARGDSPPGAAERDEDESDYESELVLPDFIEPRADVEGPSLVAEPPEKEKSDAEPANAEGGAPPKRRRRRRGRKRDSAAEPKAAVETSAKTEDESDDEDLGDNWEEDESDELSDTSETSGAKGSKPSVSHRDIPSWEEAIGVIVATNLEARANSPGGGAQHGRRRGGRGRPRGGKS